MAGIGPGDLDSLALEILQAAVAALDSIPTFAGLESLQGAPERQYVSPGRPMPDCEQIAVHVSQIVEDATPPTGTGAGTRHRQQFRVNLPTFVVTLLRCVPGPASSMKPPTVDQLEVAGAQFNADAWAMWNHIWNLLRAGELLGKCKLVYMDRVQALEPAGGYGGWALTIRAQTEGYEEAIVP